MSIILSSSTSSLKVHLGTNLEKKTNISVHSNNANVYIYLSYFICFICLFIIIIIFIFFCTKLAKRILLHIIRLGDTQHDPLKTQKTFVTYFVPTYLFRYYYHNRHRNIYLYRMIHLKVEHSFAQYIFMSMNIFFNFNLK